MSCFIHLNHTFVCFFSQTCIIIIIIVQDAFKSSERERKFFFFFFSHTQLSLSFSLSLFYFAADVDSNLSLILSAFAPFCTTTTIHKSASYASCNSSSSGKILSQNRARVCYVCAFNKSSKNGANFKFKKCLFARLYTQLAAAAATLSCLSIKQAQSRATI